MEECESLFPHSLEQASSGRYLVTDVKQGYEPRDDPSRAVVVHILYQNASVLLEPLHDGCTGSLKHASRNEGEIFVIIRYCGGSSSTGYKYEGI